MCDGDVAYVESDVSHVDDDVSRGWVVIWDVLLYVTAAVMTYDVDS